MFTCKQVSKALENGDYHDLPFWKRMGLRFHVAFCAICGRYNKQVMNVQSTCRHVREHDEKHGECCGHAMEDSKKTELEALIAEQMKNQEK